MNIDLTFNANYALENSDKIKKGEQYYYPEGSNKEGKDGVVVQVIPFESKDWVGVFAFGTFSSKGISGIYTMPNPNRFCIVSKGSGYIVSVNDNKDWEEVESIPILDVRSIKEQGILVFSNYTDLVAYDEIGVKWRTERLSQDGFKIIEITKSIIKGEFWNPRNEAYDLFEVDLSTGIRVR
ncbi:hypothetical protein [Myroides odoratus]|uniref:hypothetical protein n=1 Tax=Myroides odoratus TaxID=256 RepID=UPI0039AF714C